MPPVLDRPQREAQSEKPRLPETCATDIGSGKGWVFPRDALPLFGGAAWGTALDTKVKHLELPGDMWSGLLKRVSLKVEEAVSGAKPIDAAFNALADQWETETAFESVVVRKAMHPAYQRIIGMGPAVVPSILRRLQREPRQWFWALTAITGENPAAELASAEAAAAVWVDWGRAKGLID